MRYFLGDENLTEINARKHFIEKITGFWFVPNGAIDGFVILESFPFGSLKDICVIYGHNFKVDKLLSSYSKDVYESNVFIFSCKKKDKKDYYMKGKNIYLIPQTDDEAPLLNGACYGFSFNPTETEVNLFNSPEKDVFKKFKQCFSLTNTINF